MSLIFMGVPLSLVQQVADLIAAEAPRPAEVAGTDAVLFVNGWSEDKLRRAYRDSQPNMRSLLEHLALHPDQEFGTHALATAIGVKDWNSVAAMLGPFSRRYKGRYQLQRPPWTQRTDRNERDHLQMPANVAAIIRSEAGI